MATLSGKWTFNKVLTKPDFVAPGYTNMQDIRFSNSHPIDGKYRFDRFLVDFNDNIGFRFDGSSSAWNVYNFTSGEWKITSEYVDFGETPQTVTDDFYAWFTKNAHPYGTEEITATVITYNDTTAEMQNGQTATIKCEGKKAVTDIVIVPKFSVEIAYGDIINEAHNGQTATLKCAGKKMKHDVVLSTLEVDELAGTWVINTSVASPTTARQFIVDGVGNFAVNNTDDTTVSLPISSIYISLGMYGKCSVNAVSDVQVSNSYYASNNTVTAYYDTGKNQYVEVDTAKGIKLRTLTINSKLAEVEYGDELLAWLKANATKQ